MNIDWSDFVPSIIATLIGFGLAIVGERIYDGSKEKVARKKLISFFTIEVESIMNYISSEKFDQMMINPIKMPTWKSAISSNNISLILSESWWQDLFSCYSELEDYNEWHNIRTKLIINNIDKKNDHRINQITNILKSQLENKDSSGNKKNIHYGLKKLHSSLKTSIKIKKGVA